MTNQINLGLVWADAGGVTPVTAVKYEGGWLAEIPTYQNFNYMVQGIDQNLLHLAESGSYDWESNIHYQVGAVVLRSGNIFRCKTANNADKLTPVDPATDATNSYWVTGNIVGDTLDQLSEHEGFKIKLVARAGTTWTGQDITIENGIPVIALKTAGATDNIGFANVSGEAAVVNLGQVGSPDSRDMAPGGGNSHRIFHEGHLPTIAEVDGGFADSPADGEKYGRQGNNWVKVTGAVVSSTPPTVTNENESWFNLTDGQLYIWINDGDSSQWVPASPTTVPIFGDPDKSRPTRNGAATTEVVSQAKVLSTGFSTTNWTGTGAALAVTNDIDSTVGAMTWIKANANSSHALFDTIRGATKYIPIDEENVQPVTDVNSLTSFTSTGFTVGSSGVANLTGADSMTSWSWKATDTITETPAGSTPYTTKYNRELGFSMCSYVGESVSTAALTRRKHGLAGSPELVLTKAIDSPSLQRFIVHSPYIGDTFSGKHLRIDQTLGVQDIGNTGLILGDDYIARDSHPAINEAGTSYISYAFRSVPGVCKVGMYKGDGVAGNEVELGFSPGFVLIKGLHTSDKWVLVDTTSIPGGEYAPNSSAAKTFAALVTATPSGFRIGSTLPETNSATGEYLYMAMANEGYSPHTINKKQVAKYPAATDPNTLSIKEGSLLAYASGFNMFGQEDSVESVPAATTVALGAGFEDKRLWLYKDKGAAYGFSEVPPLEGEETYGRPVVGAGAEGQRSVDYQLLNKDFSRVEMPSGHPWASSSSSPPENAFAEYFTGAYAYWASTGSNNYIAYAHSEPRVLKSWRFKGDIAAKSPLMGKVQGSNDGTTWVDLDLTYVTTGFPASAGIWTELFSLPANVTAYNHHRFVITSVVDSGTEVRLAGMEFNTVSGGDRYSVAKGVMRNLAGTPINRVYLAELITNSTGGVISLKTLGEAKAKLVDVEVHGQQVNRGSLTVQGNLQVDGDIASRGVANAWAIIDQTTTPHTLVKSYNISHITDLGVGVTRIGFKEPMDSADYIISAGSDASNGIRVNQYLARAATGCSVVASYPNNSVVDLSAVMVVIFGGKY